MFLSTSWSTQLISLLLYLLLSQRKTGVNGVFARQWNCCPVNSHVLFPANAVQFFNSTMLFWEVSEITFCSKIINCQPTNDQCQLTEVGPENLKCNCLTYRYTVTHKFLPTTSPSSLTTYWPPLPTTSQPHTDRLYRPHPNHIQAAFTNHTNLLTIANF